MLGNPGRERATIGISALNAMLDAPLARLLSVTFLSEEAKQ